MKITGWKSKTECYIHIYTYIHISIYLSIYIYIYNICDLSVFFQSIWLFGCLVKVSVYYIQKSGAGRQ